MVTPKEASAHYTQLFQYPIRIEKRKGNTISTVLEPHGFWIKIPSYADPLDKQVHNAIQKTVEKFKDRVEKPAPQILTPKTRIIELVYEWLDKMNRLFRTEAKVKKVQLVRVLTRWGSCTSDGTIRLNQFLEYFPEREVEGVIAHEVVHLLIFNHSSNFWSHLNTLMPDYDSRKRSLEDRMKDYDF